MASHDLSMPLAFARLGIAMSANSIPTVFISYSWDDDDHRSWVRDIATRLRTEGGVDVTLDQWDAVPGDHLPEFMAKAVRESDFVLIVCTPNYKSKSDRGTGGVGYEGDIMSGEVMTERNHRKFIPVLRHGDWLSASPSWVKGKYYIRLTGDPYSEEAYLDLLKTLHGRRAMAPPISRAPGFDVDHQDLLAIANEISEVANTILQTNQTALVPLFQNSALRYRVGKQLTALYHEQAHRARFTEWQSFLGSFASNTDDILERSICDRLLREVDKLYRVFYTYARSIKDKGERETTKHFVELVLGARGSDPRWYCMDDADVVQIAERYLENVRGSVERIGCVIGELRATR